MPELPEVETVCRGLRPRLEGRVLARVTTRRPDLRFPLPADFAARLTGRRVTRIDRRAKYILAHLDDGMVWLTHLGMSGRMVVAAGPSNVVDKHDHVTIDTDAGDHVVYNDTRRFGFMDLFPAESMAAHPRLAGLGPEPLGPELTGPRLERLLHGRTSSLKAALLDQRIVAGLGNIYVCEALFRAGLSPERPAGSVSGRRAARLAESIRAVLAAAIAAGGSSIRDYVQTSGELGYFQHDWTVYGREGEACPRCAGTVAIRRVVQSGRSTFHCAKCQR